MTSNRLQTYSPFDLLSGATAVSKTTWNNHSDNTAPRKFRKYQNTTLQALSPVNSTLIASSDSFSTSQNNSLIISGATLLINDTHADGNIFKITEINSTGSLGRVSFDGTNVTYNPNGKFTSLGVGKVATDRFTYTVSDGQGGTASATATVIINGINDKPVSKADTGYATRNKAVTFSAADLLRNDRDPDGDILKITSVTGAVNGSVSLDAQGNAVFTPKTDFIGNGSFNYVVSDGNGGSTTARVNVAVNLPQSIFVPTAVPGKVATDGTGSAGDYELGMQFSSAQAGQIQALRYYKAPGETGIHVGRIWSNTGQLLASVTFTNETASGWQQQSLSTPLTLAPNTRYVVSVNTNLYYGIAQNGLAAPLTQGTLTAWKGVFNEVPGALPTQTFENSHYFRDVVFVPSLPPVTGNPGTLAFSVAAFSVNEDGTPVAVVTVTRTIGSVGVVGATVTLTNGTATAPGDFNNSPIAVSFADGDMTPKTVIVPIVNDTALEAAETINLSLGSPTGGAILGARTTAVLTIVDNDSLPTLSLSPGILSLNEGNSGTTVFNFTVSLSAASGQTVTVPYTINNGTALAGSDYIDNDGSLTFNPGETTKTITVQVNGDTAIEGNETFSVNLGSPSNANLGSTSSATATILNEDNPSNGSWSNNTLEFTGPLPSWVNLKTVYGAIGNGSADDTQAIQRALNDLAATGKPSVLYIPEGTYKISQPLNLFKARNVAIVGQSPDLVTLRWAGSAGGTMLNFENTAYSRVQRITVDGANLAGDGLWIKWNGQGENFPTTFDVSDNVFKNLTVGVRGGEYPTSSGYQSTGAEVSIQRTKFLGNTEAGIVLDDYNTIDWWIRDSRFENNRNGIRNDFGNFQVSNSVFKNSTVGDIFAQNNGIMGLRNNYSIGSPYFYKAGGPTGAGLTAVIQGNEILDVTDSAIQIPNAGPVTLFDNTIRNSAANTKSAVSFGGFSPGNIVSVGNTFSVANPIQNNSNNRVLTFDDTIVNRSSIVVAEPSLPSTPLTASAVIIQVTEKTGVAIQAAINRAARDYSGQRPIVHLPAGGYLVSSTITIPAGSDLRLVGDAGYQGTAGKSSSLSWTGAMNGTLLSIEGPSRAVVQDIAINGASQNQMPRGIVIKGVDQPDGRILLDQPITNGFANTGAALRVEGLDNTSVDAINFNLAGNKGISVIGGPLTAAGQATTSRVNLFGGTGGSLGSGPSFNVDQGGRLLVRDYWYENGGANKIPSVNLTGSGTLTLDNLYLAFQGAASGSISTIDNFTGQATFNGVNFVGSSLDVKGNDPDTDVLVVGSSFIPRNGASSTFSNSTIAGQVSFLQNARDTSNGLTQYANQGVTDTSWLRSMLTPLRQQTLMDRSFGVPSGATDLMLMRIGMENVTDGFIITS